MGYVRLFSFQTIVNVSKMIFIYLLSLIKDGIFTKSTEIQDLYEKSICLHLTSLSDFSPSLLLICTACTVCFIFSCFSNHSNLSLLKCNIDTF
jgi:flagellar biosynthesis protein FlhB